MVDGTDRNRATRSDAVLNRQRVFDAAVVAFRVDGLTASVNAIARNAGVGVGTLYRHFPTKELLLAEVLTARLADLAVVSHRLTATGEPDPGRALAAWVTAVADHIANFTAAAEWVEPALTHHDRIRALHLQVLDDGSRLLTRAAADGGARLGVSIDDLLASIVALCKSATPTDLDRPRRLVALLIRGVLIDPPADA